MKYHWAINIGYDKAGIGSGTLARDPILWVNLTPKDFTKAIREQCRVILDYGEGNNVPISAVVLFVAAENSKRSYKFRISMMNVREYKAMYDEKYKSKTL